jgi:hypothetical protein
VSIERSTKACLIFYIRIHSSARNIINGVHEPYSLVNKFDTESSFCRPPTRLGLAKTLMDYFENVSVNNNAFFVDLFVRASNSLAIQMYEKFGYVTYRRVLGYYSGELPEDALDMRKALPRCVLTIILDVIKLLIYFHHSKKRLMRSSNILPFLFCTTAIQKKKA